jgi:hypothetical protein
MFKELISDLFPDVDFKKGNYKELDAVIQNVQEDMNLEIL